MTYSYSTPSYVQNNPYGYQIAPYRAEKKSSMPAATAGAVAGLAGGAIVGARKSTPYMVNGVPTTDFVKLVYNKYLPKASEAEQLAHKQGNEIINKLNSIKTVDELKILLNNNAEASKEITETLHTSLDEYLNSVSDKNLTSNKDLIKQKMELSEKLRLENFKNKITQAWDAEKKAFAKPDNMDDAVFKAIKDTTGKAKTKFIAKYAAATAAIAGAVTYILHKIITGAKHNHQQ